MGSTPVGISASRGAAVLGLSEYQSQFDVWLRICEERRPGFCKERGYVPPEPVDNAAVRWGHAFEDAIIELAEARTGKSIKNREAFFATDGKTFSFMGQPNPRHFITCHIDGCYDGLTQIHEGKTTGLFNFWENWGKPGTDRIPKGYTVQTQHQMLCTGAGEDIVSVLVLPKRPEEWEKEGITVSQEGRRFFIWRNEHDEQKRECVSEPSVWARTLAEMGFFHQYPCTASRDLQKLLVDAYSLFWHNNVLPEREPEITTYEDVRRAFPEPKGTVVADEQVERWAMEWAEIGEEIGKTGRLGKRREELKVLMLKYMRAKDKAIDEESREKTVLRDRQGKKLAQFDGKSFR